MCRRSLYDLLRNAGLCIVCACAILERRKAKQEVLHGYGSHSAILIVCRRRPVFRHTENYELLIQRLYAELGRRDEIMRVKLGALDPRRVGVRRRCVFTVPE